MGVVFIYQILREERADLQGYGQMAFGYSYGYNVILYSCTTKELKNKAILI